MNQSSARFPALLVVITSALLLSGTRACQEDYDLASQSTVPTAEPTDDGVQPVGTRTPTETPTPTETATSEPSTTPTVGGTVTVAPTETVAVVAAALLRDLGSLSGQNIAAAPVAALPTSALVAAPNNLGGSEGRTYVENWLGKIYAARVPLDSDGDGYSDALEADFETDPQNKNSQPPPPVTLLDSRLGISDADLDGLSQDVELDMQLDTTKADSDGDGISDGAEVLSMSDPLDRRSMPQPDSDHDGLSDAVEAKYHTNPSLADSDKDGASDSSEIAVGSNPLIPDSDGDGILDGKELELGSDPTVPERQR